MTLQLNIIDSYLFITVLQRLNLTFKTFDHFKAN